MTVDAYIEKLTLEEKAALLQGKSQWKSYAIPRLGIPDIFLSDGPHGLRKQAGTGDHLGLNPSVPATCFPTAATMANSWDPSLGEKLGQALGEEAAANRVNVVLGPGLNIKRSPLCGRNFEYFSEDPYLAGKMAAAYIRGIQSRGVAACPKHFAVNSQELRRMAMDSVVDERTLRELYLTGFEIAVEEGDPKAIMSSYNMVNGTYANENSHLLTDILRQEWGFGGFVVTDWGGDNDHVEGVRAGSDLVMPGPGADTAIGLIQAVKSGQIREETLDARLRELLPVVFSTAAALENAPETFDQAAHHAIAYECAAQSIVLLENDGILPLAQGTKVAVIGDFAETPRYQGAGSSVVNPTRLDSLLEQMPHSGLTMTKFCKGYRRASTEPDPALVDEAVEAAKAAEAVLLCIGLDEIAESEGLDRTHMNLPNNQLALIAAVAAVNPNVVLVISGGSPFCMPQSSQYRAAIHGYLGGQAGAGAMLDAITGKRNPCGKLSETWPLNLEDVASSAYYPSKERTSEYREGLYVGYRYFDTAGVSVRYPFGHGLSYTSFAYSDLEASDREVCFTLTNTGSHAGAEIAQIYVSRRDGQIYRPQKELKGFQKVFLGPGERRRVTVKLDDKAFRYFNTVTDRWEVESGDYEICVCSSAAECRLRQSVQVQGQAAPMPAAALPSYVSGHVKHISDAEFTALLGRPIPDGSWSGDITRNDAICQLYYARSALARGVYKLLTAMVKRSEAKGKPNLNLLFNYNMPFRVIGKMTGGLVSQQMVDDIVFLVNGHFWRGLGRLIADFFRNSRASQDFNKKLEG